MQIPALFAGQEPPLEVLEAVLDSPDFGSEREVWGIRFKRPKEPPDFDIFSRIRAVFSGLEGIKRNFARILFGGLIIIIGGAGISVLIYLYAYPKRNAPEKEPPVIRAAGRTKPEHPDSYFTRSRTLYAQGRTREAWAACFAGLIAVLEQKGAGVLPGATEYDCLDAVRRKIPEEAEPFAEALNHWIQFAYSGKPPEPGAFETSLQFAETLSRRREGYG
jgi:hypothetical protein